MSKAKSAASNGHVQLTHHDPLVRGALRKTLRNRGIAVFGAGEELRVPSALEQEARAVERHVLSVQPRFRLLPLEDRWRIVRENRGLIARVARELQRSHTTVARVLYSERQSRAIAAALDRQINKLPAAFTAQV